MQRFFHSKSPRLCRYCLTEIDFGILCSKCVENLYNMDEDFNHCHICGKSDNHILCSDCKFLDHVVFNCIPTNEEGILNTDCGEYHFTINDNNPHYTFEYLFVVAIHYNKIITLTSKFALALAMQVSEFDDSKVIKQFTKNSIINLFSVNKSAEEGDYEFYYYDNHGNKIVSRDLIGDNGLLIKTYGASIRLVGNQTACNVLSVIRRVF